MQAAGRRATDAHQIMTSLAARVSSEIDDLPTNGAPLVEMHDDDSLVTSIERAIGVKKEVVENIAVARTRSQDL